MLTSCLLVFLSCMQAMADNDNVRATLALDSNWQFYPAYDVSRHPKAETVSVPHTWNLDDVFSGMKYERGAYMYEHSLKYDARQMKGKRVMAVSAIGNPASFEQTLANLGAVVVESLRFPDHHDYTEQEMLDAANLAVQMDAVFTRSVYGHDLRPHLVDVGA